jgi:hypothetical protein
MAAPLKPRPGRLRYHAVSIIAGPKCCSQVQSLKGVRLLSLEAPRLPLAGCSCPEACGCRFQHHDDRRSGSRRSEFRSKSSAWATDNRRQLHGRRDSDYGDN